MHSPKQPCHFRLLLQVFQLFITVFHSTCKYIAVPGELSSKFTTSKKPYEADKMMQTSKCISWQIMHYDKSVI